MKLWRSSWVCSIVTAAHLFFKSEGRRPKVVRAAATARDGRSPPAHNHAVASIAGASQRGVPQTREAATGPPVAGPGTRGSRGRGEGPHVAGARAAGSRGAIGGLGGPGEIVAKRCCGAVMRCRSC